MFVPDLRSQTGNGGNFRFGMNGFQNSRIYIGVHADILIRFSIFVQILLPVNGDFILTFIVLYV